MTLNNCYKHFMELSYNSKTESDVLNVIFKTTDGNHHQNDDENKYILPEDRIIKHMDNFIIKYGITIDEQFNLKYYIIELEIKLLYAVQEHKSKIVTNGLPQNVFF